MIRGMKCKNNLPRSILALLFLALRSTAIGAPSSGSLQSTPEIHVMVYRFPALQASLLQSAEGEAALMLRPAAIKLEWADCTWSAAARCMSPQAETDLVVRFLRKALPNASADALGIAGTSGGYGTAFIFFERVFALRTQARPLPFILGRVLAHEIVHLLLPP